MRLTRRQTIGAGLVGLAALGASPLLTRRIDDEVRRVLRRNFGRRIARSADARLFVADMSKLWEELMPNQNWIVRPSYWMLEFASARARQEREGLEEIVIELFLRATNAVRAYEIGSELEYVGITTPFETPCSNTLSVAWL